MLCTTNCLLFLLCNIIRKSSIFLVNLSPKMAWPFYSKFLPKHHSQIGKEFNLPLMLGLLHRPNQRVTGYCTSCKDCYCTLMGASCARNDNFGNPPPPPQHIKSEEKKWLELKQFQRSWSSEAYSVVLFSLIAKRCVHAQPASNSWQSELPARASVRDNRGVPGC